MRHRHKSRNAEPDEAVPAEQAKQDGKTGPDGAKLDDPPLPEKRPVYRGDPPLPPTSRGAVPAKPSTTVDVPQNVAPSAQFGPPVPQMWTEAEVKAGRAECAALLPGFDGGKTDLPPIREGGCGLAAPILLKTLRVTDAAGVEVSPEATVSCKLTAALETWFATVVEPRAKAHLGGPVVKIENASAYVCRTRYNDPTQRISAHAYANAIDITEFVTAKGEHISVLADWNGGGEKGAFLHEIHDAACEIFGTTLGPEANEAHKNHFHLDMIERRHGLCDFAPGQAVAKRAAADAAKTAAAPAAPTGQPAGPDAAKADEAAKKTAKGDTGVAPKREPSRIRR